MTRLEGIVFVVMFFVLALLTATMADNSVGWVDWIACAILSVSCTGYCIYYMLRVFGIKPRL
jgi:hypothetical protein